MRKIILTDEEQKSYDDTLNMIKNIDPNWGDLTISELEILKKGLSKELQSLKKLYQTTSNSKVYRSIEALTKMIEHIKLCLKYTNNKEVFTMKKFNLTEILNQIDISTIRDRDGKTDYYIQYLLDKYSEEKGTTYYNTVKNDMLYILKTFTTPENINELYSEIYKEIEKSMDEFISNNNLELIDCIKEIEKDSETVNKLIDIIVNHYSTDEEKEYILGSSITVEDLDKAREFYGPEYDEEPTNRDIDYFDIPIICQFRYFD
jgi:ATP-dependent Lon protease